MNQPKRLRLVPVNSPEGQAIAAKRRQIADRMRSNEDKARHVMREAASKFRRSL